MKIDPIHNMNIQKAYRAGNAKNLKPERPASGGDEAIISEDALTFSKALSALREADNAATETDAKRLSDLKVRVNRGEYNIEGRLVAEKILSKLNFGAQE